MLSRTDFLCIAIVCQPNSARDNRELSQGLKCLQNHVPYFLLRPFRTLEYQGGRVRTMTGKKILHTPLKKTFKRTLAFTNWRKFIYHLLSHPFVPKNTILKLAHFCNSVL